MKLGAVEGGAYLSGELRSDADCTVAWDRRRKKHEIAASGVHGPTGWNGERLWAEVEKREARADAIYGRRVIADLPCQISDAARLEIVHGFAEMLRGWHGVGVEWAIHRPPRKGNGLTLSSLTRRDLDGHLGKLPAAARLLDLLALAGGRVGDGLAVGDARLARSGFHAMVEGELFPDDLQVQLAHARDERLARLGVRADVEGRVLVGQPGQRGTQLLLVGARLRLDGHRHDRLGEARRLQRTRADSLRRGCRPCARP